MKFADMVGFCREGSREYTDRIFKEKTGGTFVQTFDLKAASSGRARPRNQCPVFEAASSPGIPSAKAAFP